MKKKNLLLLALMVFTLIFLAASCSTLANERVSSDECLVLVHCEVINPDNVKKGRFFKFQLSTGETTEFIKKSYVALIVKEPGVFISTITSQVGEGFRGKRSSEAVQIHLPYEAGKVIVADQGFKHELTKVSSSTTSSNFRFGPIIESQSLATLTTAQQDKALVSWFASPESLSSLGYQGKVDSSVMAKKPQSTRSQRPGIIRVSSDVAGIIRVSAIGARPIQPGETLKLEELPPGIHSVELVAADGQEYKQSISLKAGGSGAVYFTIALEGSKATKVNGEFQGPGYRVRYLGLLSGWIRDIYVFTDKQYMYVRILYSSTFKSSYSLFNPPGGTVFMVRNESGILPGDRAVTIKVTRAKVDKNNDFTFLLYDYTGRPGLYFVLSNGTAGLTEIVVPDSIKLAAKQ